MSIKLDYLNKNEALEILDKCLKEGIIVLGIDRFILRDNKIVPDMDGIGDFSSVNSKADNIKAIEVAKQIVLEMQVDTEYRFEIVTAENINW